jgi:nifR3 family TIM-barrel protein
LYPVERPIGIQIYGNRIDAMVGAARLAEELRPELIDINFGCPVRKIATKGYGAGMLRDIPKLLAITEAVVKAVRIPVTVKTRLGWDEASKIIVGLAEQLQDTGISALTIHGRTREQIYSGVADWTLIGQVKNNPRMKIPIIGNGDIDSGEKARQMFDRYGVDGLMIGRAAIGNPHIFREVRHFLDTGENLPPRTISEQVDQLKQLIEKSIEWNGLPGGILHTRRHMALNFKGLPDFRPLRVKMLRSNNKEELWGILEEIEKRYQGH